MNRRAWLLSITFIIIVLVNSGICSNTNQGGASSPGTAIIALNDFNFPGTTINVGHVAILFKNPKDNSYKFVSVQARGQNDPITPEVIPELTLEEAEKELNKRGYKKYKIFEVRDPKFENAEAEIDNLRNAKFEVGASTPAGLVSRILVSVGSFSISNLLSKYYNCLTGGIKILEKYGAEMPPAGFWNPTTPKDYYGRFSRGEEYVWSNKGNKYVSIATNAFKEPNLGDISSPISSKSEAMPYQSVQPDVALQTLLHDERIKSIKFSPDGSMLATGGWDHTARIWDVVTGTQLYKLKHASTVNSVAFSPDGSMLATAAYSPDGLRIFDIATGEELQEAELREFVLGDYIYSVAFSPDGSKIAVGGSCAAIWDVTRREELYDFILSDNSIVVVNSVIFSPDGSKLAAACDDTTTRIWDVASGMELHKLKHGGNVRSIVFNSDGSKLAAGCEAYTIIDSEGCPIPSHSDRAAYISTAKIWDVASGAELHGLCHLTNRLVYPCVNSVAFSPDGTKLATGSWDGTARIWDVATGEELHRMVHPWSAVSSVDFSPDSRKLATSGYDNTARIWDVASGKELQVLKHDGDSVNFVVFSPDGSKLATTDEYYNSVTLSYAGSAARIWSVAA